MWFFAGRAAAALEAGATSSYDVAMRDRDLSRDFVRFVRDAKGGPTDGARGSLDAAQTGIARGFASLRRFVRTASAGESVLLVAEVESGRLVVREDAIAGPTLADIRSVVARAPSARGTLYVFAAKEGARVDADDLDDALVQQIRNVVGIVPVQRLTRSE